MILGCLAALAAGFEADAADTGFDELYAGSASLSTQINTLIYKRSVQPVWKDRTTFLYSTAEADGQKVYEVDLQAGTKTLSVQESIDAVIRRNSPKAEYYDPSDESYFSMPGKISEVSPDGKWIAFVQDNNVWIRQSDKKADAIQLSFDGADDDCYVQLMWSPDSRKLAARARTS